MFTGIIEDLGKVVSLEKKGSNLHITLVSNIASHLKIDQSVSHNGVCLTVVRVYKNTYSVVAIKETLEKSNLSGLQINDTVNLERAMILGNRLDGHLVQGHVDETAKCTEVKAVNGSWLFRFKYASTEYITVEKGSITINGVSLTVINIKPNAFSVAIIPYTYNNTTFKTLKINDTVNLEFDIIGKYVRQLIDPIVK